MGEPVGIAVEVDDDRPVQEPVKHGGGYLDLGITRATPPTPSGRRRRSSLTPTTGYGTSRRPSACPNTTYRHDRPTTTPRIHRSAPDHRVRRPGRQPLHRAPNR